MSDSTPNATNTTTDGVSCRESYSLCGVDFAFDRTAGFEIPFTVVNNNDAKVFVEVLNLDDGAVFFAKCMPAFSSRMVTIEILEPTLIQMNFFHCDSDKKVYRDQIFCGSSGETCSLH